MYFTFFALPYALRFFRNYMEVMKKIVSKMMMYRVIWLFVTSSQWRRATWISYSCIQFNLEVDGKIF